MRRRGCFQDRLAAVIMSRGHYGHSGHVWQGRFKAFPIQEDEHLLTVIRYVERSDHAACDQERSSSLSGSLDDAGRLFPMSTRTVIGPGAAPIELETLPLPGTKVVGRPRVVVAGWMPDPLNSALVPIAAMLAAAGRLAIRNGAVVGTTAAEAVTRLRSPMERPTADAAAFSLIVSLIKLTDPPAT
jgi:hypothetical protein